MWCFILFQCFSLCFETMPVFNTLKTLRIRIRSSSSRGWKALPVLLNDCSTFRNSTHKGTNLSKKHYHIQRSFFKLSPLLQLLCFQRLFLWDSISREDKDLWLTSCPLKKIQIESCGGTTGEMKMVKHLLESSPCLKEMKIFAFKDYPKDIFDFVVKMVNLCNESYRVVVFNFLCVIHRI